MLPLYPPKITERLVLAINNKNVWPVFVNRQVKSGNKFPSSLLLYIVAMIPGWQKIGLAVVLCAFFYQWYLKDLLFVTMGIGRTLQSIDDFPYTCRRLRHERLEGCEDLWLDDEGRVLYAACSGSVARSQWNQG
jgi:hypothetical protein